MIATVLTASFVLAGPPSEHCNAVAALESACAKHDAAACAQLARCLADGQGVARDLGRAASLAADGCRGGQPLACLTLSSRAVREQFGSDRVDALLDEACGRVGVACGLLASRLLDSPTSDRSRVAGLLDRACRQGDDIGCVMLADLQLDNPSLGVPAKDALERLVAKCDAGVGMACSSAGRRLHTGDGVPIDKARAVDLVARACEAGEGAGACNAAGTLLSEGDRDLSRAAVCFERACSEAYAPSCGMLALAYRDGRGVARDVDRAAQLFGKACDLGLEAACVQGGAQPSKATPPPLSNETLDEDCRKGGGNACNLLGSRLMSGRGATRDPKGAADLFERACSLGVLDGCVQLGECLELGLGRTKDEPSAVALYRRSCDEGDMGGCGNLGTKLVYGEGTPADVPKGLAALRKACDGRNALGCLKLGAMAADPKLPEIPHTAAEVVGWMRHGCDLGEARGCAFAAAILAEGGDAAAAATLRCAGCDLGDVDACKHVAVDALVATGDTAGAERAVERLLKVCQDGPQAGEECLAAGSLLVSGKVKTSPLRASLALGKACGYGLGKGCTVLGLALEQGTGGLPIDAKLAKENYRRGCEAGDSEGCARAK